MNLHFSDRRFSSFNVNADDLKKDAERAHAVFDLCGIGRKTRGPMPRSLRIRALMLAEKANIIITDEMLDAQLAKIARESAPTSTGQESEQI